MSTKRTNLLSYGLTRNQKSSFINYRTENSFARTKYDESLSNSSQMESSSLFSAKKLSFKNPGSSPRTLLSKNSKRNPTQKLDFNRSTLQTISPKDTISNSRNAFLLKSSFKSYSTHGEYLVKSFRKATSSVELVAPKAAYNIPDSIIKSRNINLLEKSRTSHRKPHITEETLSEMCEVQKESKIQVPVRFRSRESLMKFGDRKPCNITQNCIENPKPKLLQEHKPSQELAKFPQTPVKPSEKPKKQSTMLDAESVLRLLRRSISKELEESPDKLPRKTPEELSRNNISTQYDPPVEFTPTSKNSEEDLGDAQLNSLNFSEFTDSQLSLPHKEPEIAEVETLAKKFVNTKEMGVNTSVFEQKNAQTQSCTTCNCASSSQKLSILAVKISELETKLNQANEKISDLTNELNEEKVKNSKISSSTMNDDTNKRGFGSFEKLKIEPIRAPIHNFKRNRSSEVSFRNRLSKQAIETLEDVEFKKLEEQAMREAKKNLNGIKDNKNEVHQTLLELRLQRNILSASPTTKASSKRPSK
ncbi:unnamed protein product [Moneuplotes crassus]|uniref:Uncharacterized protein n=1 Tax=Euplotes crassus TaxID=5936 RepID=A0AAD1U7C8_EUPCR|nr:unnamed protein product [Moneuplotes crassus]